MWLLIPIIICIIFYFINSFFSSFLEKERSNNQYKTKFKLNKEENKQLNKQLPLVKEHFSQIFCIEETIRFYLRVFREFPPNKQTDYMLNRKLVQYCIHLIKVKYDFKPETTDQLLMLQQHFSSNDIALIEKHAKSIVPLNDEEEKKLFSHDNQRWKRKYDEILPAFDANNPDDFYGNIIRLASLNKDVRLVDTRNIFYKSYLFMVEHHKETSLKLYLHYLNVKSTSSSFKHKQISTRNTSKLFDNKEKKVKFDAICKKLIKDHKLEKALEGVSEIYQPVRRKIHLNIESIQEAKAKQANVAKILGTYLNDEPEVETIENTELIETNTTGNNQKELFDLFISNAYRLNQQEVNIFVQSKGLFKDQFIESINEQYYETLDDLLIEEEEDEFILNEEYYKEVARNNC